MDQENKNLKLILVFLFLLLTPLLSWSTSQVECLNAVAFVKKTISRLPGESPRAPKWREDNLPRWVWKYDELDNWARENEEARYDRWISKPENLARNEVLKNRGSSRVMKNIEKVHPQLIELSENDTRRVEYPANRYYEGEIEKAIKEFKLDKFLSSPFRSFLGKGNPFFDIRSEKFVTVYRGLHNIEDLRKLNLTPS